MWKKVEKRMNHFFSGATDAKLDAKNRFVLPQNMRFGLVEDGVLEFSLCLGLGGCLVIYKRSDILKIVERFKKNLHIAKYQKFFTLFFSTLHHSSCDKIGRVIVPNRLKETVQIQKEVVVAGVLNKIEIWPKEAYDKNLNKILKGDDKELSLEKMTEEVFSLLEERENRA